MIGMKVRTTFDAEKVKRRVKAGSIESLGHAGAAIRLAARHSIRRSALPSAPGTPPHTRRGALKGAIKYAVEKDAGRVVIGPAYSGVGPSGMPHEFGGLFRGGKYKKRPFMGPALTAVKDRLPSMWAASVR
jgi:hypothetical protein